MERYDPGLKIIAQAQKERDADQYAEAHTHFVQGIEQLLQLLQTERDEKTEALVRKHVKRFLAEAEEMKEAQSQRGRRPQSQRVRMLQATAQGIETRARKAERELKYWIAKDAYLEAATSYRSIRQEVEDGCELHAWAGRCALEMVNGAERMQTLFQGASTAKTPDDDVLNLPHAPGSAAAEAAKRMPVNFAKPDPSLPNALPNSLTETFVRGKTKKNPAEERVLIVGDKINGRKYERMHAQDGDWSNFQGSDFKDPDGQPRMSQKQKDKHGVWARPSQIFRNPTLIQHFTFESITQTLVADCSFVSSLAVCAAWERRFGRTLISRNIYPQQDGVPVMSPSGKYIVKMYLNGSVRKITIDDYLPVMQESPSTLLCSFSSKGDELWVSLFEKAYIKLHAGYDFPGSTSSVDLHALCGWIPEHFSFTPNLPPAPPAPPADPPPATSSDGTPPTPSVPPPRPPPPPSGPPPPPPPAAAGPPAHEDIAVATVAAVAGDEGGEDIVVAQAVAVEDVGDADAVPTVTPAPAPPAPPPPAPPPPAPPPPAAPTSVPAESPQPTAASNGPPPPGAPTAASPKRAGDAANAHTVVRVGVVGGGGGDGAERKGEAVGVREDEGRREARNSEQDAEKVRKKEQQEEEERQEEQRRKNEQEAEEAARKAEEEQRQREQEEASARVKEYEDAVAAAAKAKEVFWTRMRQGQTKGTALFTITTRELTHEEQDASGLLSRYPYAVLRVEEVPLAATKSAPTSLASPRDGAPARADPASAHTAAHRRLVQIKCARTPATCKWKGYYAAEDARNWTEELREGLGYTTQEDVVKDGEAGIFWIAWEDVQAFFEGIHSSWSPARFSFRRDVHSIWKRPFGPQGHLDDNPQYILRVTAATDTVLWLVLFPHYSPHPPTIEGGTRTQTQVPRLALHTFKGNRKAYYLGDELAKPWKVEYGAHYASVRLTCPRGEQAFVIVLAADRCMVTSGISGGGGGLAYTLTCYSTEPSGIYNALDSPAIEVQPPADATVAAAAASTTNGASAPSADPPGIFCKTFRYKWTEESAGGALGGELFGKNPMFRLDSEVPQRVFVKLRCEGKGAQVGVHLFSSGERVSSNDTEQRPAAGSTEYRGHIAWREYDLQAGSSSLVAASDVAGYVAEFVITVKARREVRVSSLMYRPAPDPKATPQSSGQGQGQGLVHKDTPAFPSETPTGPSAAVGYQPMPMMPMSGGYYYPGMGGMHGGMHGGMVQPVLTYGPNGQPMWTYPTMQGMQGGGGGGAVGYGDMQAMQPYPYTLLPQPIPPQNDASVAVKPGGDAVAPEDTAASKREEERRREEEASKKDDTGRGANTSITPAHKDTSETPADQDAAATSFKDSSKDGRKDSSSTDGSKDTDHADQDAGAASFMDIPLVPETPANDVPGGPGADKAADAAAAAAKKEAEEAEARKIEEDAASKKKEEAAAKRKEEEAKAVEVKRREEEAATAEAKRKEEEAAKKKEEAAAKKKEEEAKAAEAKSAEEDAQKRRAEEDAAAKQKEEEAAAKRRKEEEEEEARGKQAEQDAAAKKKLEEAAAAAAKKEEEAVAKTAGGVEEAAAATQQTQAASATAAAAAADRPKDADEGAVKTEEGK